MFCISIASDVLMILQKYSFHPAKIRSVCDIALSSASLHIIGSVTSCLKFRIPSKTILVSFLLWFSSI